MWLTGVVLTGASWFDVREQRIPNWWSFGAAIFGAVFCLLQSPVEVIYYLVRLIGVTVFFFPFFMVRVLGAGDVKLMAFMVGSLGFSEGIWAVGYGFVIGAVMALGKMCLQRSLLRRVSIFLTYVMRLVRTRKLEVYYQAERDQGEGVIPFAVCLLLGFLGSLVW